MGLLTKNKRAYSEKDPNTLILRDRLALDRTILANERTVLAYVRTTAALFIFGITLLHFFPEDRMFLAVGSVSIITSLVTTLLGINRYIKMREILHAVHQSKAN